MIDVVGSCSQLLLQETELLSGLISYVGPGKSFTSRTSCKLCSYVCVCVCVCVSVCVAVCGCVCCTPFLAELHIGEWNFALNKKRGSGKRKERVRE